MSSKNLEVSLWKIWRIPISETVTRVQRLFMDGTYDQVDYRHSPANLESKPPSDFKRIWGSQKSGLIEDME